MTRKIRKVSKKNVPSDEDTESDSPEIVADEPPKKKKRPIKNVTSSEEEAEEEDEEVFPQVNTESEAEFSPSEPATENNSDSE